MPPTFPWPIPSGALDEWGLLVGPNVHRATTVGRRVAVDGTIVPATWATAEDGAVTFLTGPCGNDRLNDLLKQRRVTRDELRRGLVGAVIAAHLGGHPDARMPNSRPNRIWTHFIAIGLGLDPGPAFAGLPE